jgi:protocatechuate 3,4-dioxygenase beta subunit
MNRSLLTLALVFGLVGVAASQTAPQGQAVTDDQNWSLEGTVIDSAGKLLDGALVRAEAREGSTAITDAEAHYVIKGAKAGRYGVFAKKDGYVYARIRYVQLMPGMHAKLDLVLEKEAVLSGRVLTRDGTPITGAEIAAWSRVFRHGSPIFALRRGARTDDTGRYRLVGLSEGVYYVGVNPRKTEAQRYVLLDPKQSRRTQLAYPPLFYPGVQLFNDASPIRLRNSEQREGVDLILEKVAAFCAIGSVSFSGLRLESGDVALMLTETAKGWGHVIGGGHAEPGEKFQICGLVPGIQYSLTSQIWGEGMNLLGFAESDFEGNRRDAELGETLDLGVLLVRTGGPVRGKITIDGSKNDGNFPKGILVALESTTALPGYINETGEAQVELTGEFVLSNVFPYEHRLRILGLPPGYYVKQETCDRDDLLEAPWRPGCGELRAVIGMDAATVSGLAVDENGQPVDDADVILVPKEASGKVAVHSVDQGGHFQFSSVIPGNYSIAAVVGIPDGQAENPDVVRNYLSHAMDLNLAAKGQQSLTLIVLSAGQ